MKLKRYDGMKRGVAFLPNMLTTANLFCGFYSVIQTFQTHYIFAVWLIILASLFDFLDGRVARMTGTQSDFGVEYDSLSDLTTFCMAPAILLYEWNLSAFGKFGVATCFLYFVCGALRLARFNVQAGGIEKTDFQGLPTPAAAGTVVTYILFHADLIKKDFPHNYFLLGLVVTVALLMVSNIRYRSMKKANQHMSFFKLVLVITTIFIIVSRPEVMLFCFGICYISYGLIGKIIEVRQRAALRKAEDLANAPQASRSDRRRLRRRQRRSENQTPSEPVSDNVVKIPPRSESSRMN